MSLVFAGGPSSVNNITRAIGDLFDVLPDAVIVVDVAGRIAFANSAVRRVLGYEAGELVGRPLGQLVPERYREQHEHHVAQFRKQGTPRPMSTRPVLYARAKSGEEVPVSISISNVDLSGERYSVAVIRDAAVVREQLDRALAQAESDVLTGIGNRLNLTRRMQSALAAGRPFALLFLDLTQFKLVNDRYGHRIGDEALRVVAKRIQALVRAKDLAVRFGGDEFVILLDMLSDERLVEMRADAIVHSLSQPFRIDNVSLTIGVNIGGAIFPRDGRTEGDLIAVADRNMYRAKQSRRPYCIDPAPAGRDVA